MNTELLKNIIKQFMPFAQKHIGFKDPPRLFLRNDLENAKNPFGSTAFYDPNQKSVTLYITGRHPKDILRSLGHELVHHKQNCAGQFSDSDDMGEGYAQRDPHLRQMEMEANRDGSMCLRDFEDMLKKENTIYYEHLQKGDNKMSTKDWKNKEITQLLSEAWGFKFNNLEEFEEFNGTGELQTEDDGEIEELAQARQTKDRRKPHRRTPVEDDDDEKELDESDEEVNEDEIEEGALGTIGGAMLGGIPGAIAGHYAQKALDKELETPGKRDDEEDEEDEEKDEIEESEEPIEEIAPMVAAGLGGAAGLMMGKRDDEDEEDEEDEDEKNESVDSDSLQEAIANLLRKHIKG
jgi:hypothetical protein